MEQTNDVKELQEQVNQLVDYNRRLSETNNLRYQLNLAASRILDDLWESRWLIVLILVEIIRLWVELDQRQISRDIPIVIHSHVHGIELLIKNMPHWLAPSGQFPPVAR